MVGLAKYGILLMVLTLSACVNVRGNMMFVWDDYSYDFSQEDVYAEGMSYLAENPPTRQAKTFCNFCFDSGSGYHIHPYHPSKKHATR